MGQLYLRVAAVAKGLRALEFGNKWLDVTNQNNAFTRFNCFIYLRLVHHTHTHSYTYTHTHTQAHTGTHRHTQTHTDTHRHTQTHTNTNTHRHRHTHGTNEAPSFTRCQHLSRV
jgi:hypothetical protein